MTSVPLSSWSTQTIAETIEILAEVIGHEINTFDQDSVNKNRQRKWIGLDKTTFSDGVAAHVRSNERHMFQRCVGLH